MNKPKGKPPEQAPRPNPILFLFAAAFVAAMFLELLVGQGSERLTIFFGTAALLILGVDIGKMIGRK